ncbi:MAG: ATP-binding protein [Desulfopila sp.]
MRVTLTCSRIAILLFGWLALLSSASTSTALAKTRYRIGVFTSAPPFSFVVIQDGKNVIRGHSIDKWLMLAKLIAVDIEFIPAADYSERLQMLRDGKIDILAGGTEIDARNLGLAFISDGLTIRHRIYVNRSCASVTCERDLQDRKVVIGAGVHYDPEILLRDDMLKLNSSLEALSLVNTGAVDAYIAYSENIADFIIDANNLSNVIKKGIPVGQLRHGYLVPKERLDLIADIELAQQRMENEGLIEILNEKWFGKSMLQENLSHYNAKQVILFICTIFFIFFVILLWNISLKVRVNKATHKLSLTEQRYRSLIESSPDMIFIVNNAGDIFHSNERARHTLDIPPDGGPCNLTQVIVSDYKEDILRFIDMLFQEGCSRLDSIMVGQGKKPIDVEIAGRVMGCLLDDATLYACLFVRDVTDRKRLEEELVQSERLGIIGKMAASVAHEINNPLGIIQANAEELMYEEVDDDIKEALTAIQNNASRAGSITKGLLELASPKPASFEILEVEGVIKGAVSLLGSKTNKERINVVCENRPLLVYGDENSLQQVVVNLLFNALNHSDSDKEIIITMTRSRDSADDTIQLIVRDFGKGIEREDLVRVFEPFFSKRKGGFGLGLFITRIMVERHGGIIYANSVPGKGTSMIIELPAYGGQYNA